MPLSADDRRALWAEWMTTNTQPCPLTKAQLREAVDAIDDWVDANLTSLGAALPVAARTGLTLKQKLRLFMAVCRRRFEVS